MLRATRRLLRPGGRTAFSVIHLPPDLPPPQRRRALKAGPSAVATRSPSYRHLIASAGFTDVEQIDVTPAYRVAQRTWLRCALELKKQLAPTEPPGRFAERIEEQALTRAALNDGLLYRSLLVGRRRGP